jgi:hypothetical protein
MPKLKFDPEGEGYDYDTAKAGGLGPDGTDENEGHWGSVTRASEDDRKKFGLPEESYVILKGRKHETWDKAEESEGARGSKIVKHGERYYSVPVKKNKGGLVPASKRADGIAIRGKTRGRMV